MVIASLQYHAVTSKT